MSNDSIITTKTMGGEFWQIPKAIVTRKSTLNGHVNTVMSTNIGGDTLIGVRILMKGAKGAGQVSKPRVVVGLKQVQSVTVKHVERVRIVGSK